MTGWKEAKILLPGYCNRETIVLSDRKKEINNSQWRLGETMRTVLGKFGDPYLVKSFCVASGRSWQRGGAAPAGGLTKLQVARKQTVIAKNKGGIEPEDCELHGNHVKEQTEEQKPRSARMSKHLIKIMVTDKM